jgi:hypothetical protein
MRIPCYARGWSAVRECGLMLFGSAKIPLFPALGVDGQLNQ